MTMLVFHIIAEQYYKYSQINNFVLAIAQCYLALFIKIVYYL